MSGQAMEQSQTHAADGAQAKPVRVSADSFRMLTQRLKSATAPSPIPPVPAPKSPVVASPIPVEFATHEVLRVPEQAAGGIFSKATSDIQPEPEEPIEVVTRQCSNDADPEPKLPSLGPVVISPVLESIQQASAKPAEPYATKNLPPVLTSPPSFESFNEVVPEPEAARDATAILSDRIGRVLARAAAPAETGTELVLPPILPPPEANLEIEKPPKRTAELSNDVIQELHRINADVKRRRDSEVEGNARMIFAVPTLEERAQYLEEAAQLAQMERAQELAQAHVAEDLEALAMEHIGKYATDFESQHENSPVQAYKSADFESLELELPTDGQPEILANPEPSPLPEGLAPQAVFVESQTISIADDLDGLNDKAIETPVLPQSVRHAVKPKAAPVAEPVHSAVQNMSEQQVSDFARSLLDMMASGSNAGLPQERALAADTLLRILPRLPQRALVQLSDRLAMMDHPPHLIVGKILQDERIEVAGPLIENGVNLGERELISLIEIGNADKLRLVARRRRLSRTITTMLIASGQTSVLLTLVRNAHAEFAHESFVMLAEAAKNEPDLLAPLCTRADLPTPQAFELFWFAPTQLRRYLLSRFLTDSETLTKILKITLATEGSEPAADAEIDPAQISEALQFLGEGKSESAYGRLAELCRTSEATIARICEDSSGEPLVAMLKILGIPRTQLSGVLQALQRSEHGVISPSRELDELQSIFDTLSNNKARILLTYWDWATQKTGPYSPVH
jgi:uncharacterized protein (DUF2336 family)